MTRDKPRPMYHPFEQKLITLSLVGQIALSGLVIGFSAYKLSTNHNKSDDAIYIGLLSSTLGYWFPSPVTGFLHPTTDKQKPRQRQSPSQKKKEDGAN